MENYNQQLNIKFSNTTATVKRSEYYDDDRYTYQLNVTFTVDSKRWNDNKKKGRDPIEAMNLVVDLSNYINRAYGVGVRLPSVSGIHTRASKGLKTLTFTYIVTITDLSLLGFKEPSGYYFRESFKLKPITVNPALKLVNEGV